MAKPATDLEATIETRNVIENAGVVVWWGVAAPPFRLDYISPNVSQWGYTADELISSDKTLLDYIHEDDRQRIIDSMATAFENANRTVDREYRLRAKDGSYRHIRERVVFIPDDGTGNPKAEAVQIDITNSDELHLRPTMLLHDRSYPVR